jgi:predicted SnoaL-like aldol condensation-catalyzing enzyme
MDNQTVTKSAEQCVREFWRVMATNDFSAIKALLSDEFVLDWPQSNERIRGADNFARMNAEYPASGPWRFDVVRLIAAPLGDDAAEVVTQVAITDGQQSAVAISFFRVSGEKISQMLEFWPENYPAPANRAHLTEPIHQDPA